MFSATVKIKSEQMNSNVLITSFCLPFPGSYKPLEIGTILKTTAVENFSSSTLIAREEEPAHKSGL